MRKSVLAASAAVLVLAGVASADYIRKLESKRVNSESLVVGEKDRDLTAGQVYVEGTSTFVGAVTASGGVVGAVTGNTTGQVFGTTPDEEIIAAAATITANACGGIKRISTDDQGAVTTGTTNTFTAPAAANKGCIMQVCNSGGTDAITLDDNALTDLSGIAGGTPGNTVLGVGDCVAVGSDGAVWRQLGPGSQN